MRSTVPPAGPTAPVEPVVPCVPVVPVVPELEWPPVVLEDEDEDEDEDDALLALECVPDEPLAVPKTQPLVGGGPQRFAAVSHHQPL